ncbi:MAG: hypothetical protein CR968_02175 [Flavobacteriia bacterium]|nr:MAG: hypothetical protein CR968_02175 [Flavobacteriia bacterium]
MKKGLLLFIAIFTFVFTVKAQNDTLYVMKDGDIVAKYNVNTEIDSIIFYKPAIVEYSTFIDERDGTEYHSVVIGNQVWMADNLRYLPTVNASDNISYSEPRYYVYDYHGTDVEEAKANPNYTDYGVLYNWAAAMAGASTSVENPSGVQGICPEGWHMPSGTEWTELMDYLGGQDVAGGKLKATGTDYWSAPNTGATDEVGFNARGGGFKAILSANYLDKKNIGYYYTSTQHEYETETAYVIFMKYDQIKATPQNYNKDYGFSVRCVQD